MHPVISLTHLLKPGGQAGHFRLDFGKKSSPRVKRTSILHLHSRNPLKELLRSNRRRGCVAESKCGEEKK
eukprot:1393001-Amorphochlora_amoeboformis.AAC.1